MKHPDAKTSIKVPDEYMPLIEDLRLLVKDQDNPNRMLKRAREGLWKSLQKYGWIYPILVDKKGMLGDGEQRLETCLSNNEHYGPVLRLDVDDVDRRLLRQITNKLRGTHDPDKDLLEYRRLIEGGRRKELINILMLNEKAIQEALKDKIKKDSYRLPPLDEVITDIKLGESFKLGNHILMCGDSLIRENILKLLNQEENCLLLTDPPYGINIVSKEGTVGRENVAKLKRYMPFQGDDTFDIKPIMDNIDLYPKMIVWGGNYFANTLPITNSWIIWDKRAGRRSWFSDFEMAWSNLGCGPRIFKFIWQGMIRQGKQIERMHPTEKPVELNIWCITELAPKYYNILDLFGGSGSTLIACEQTDRKCYMMELDPRYCQIIIDRWEAYTGEKAAKIEVT